MSTEIALVHAKPDEEQKKQIEKFYQNEMMPAEKKPYLTDLPNGVGPYLPTQNNKFILDGSSQIATMGLGFNPTAFYGVSRYYETWTNDPTSADFQRLKDSYKKFLLRKVGWAEGAVHFCHSGAEANEIALGHCFQNRFSENQKKVLAFEGSFHGRMMVTLSATYNPSKREPYEWPSFKADYVDWPKLSFDHRSEGELPRGWKELWENPNSSDFQKKIEYFSSQSAFYKEEIRCLLLLKEKLSSGQHFALILEPRQCEGGDRYGSKRFHNAVGILCHLYNVPYIYDEVQCGYGLSGEFFWHRLFQNTSSLGLDLGPSYVTCAKKAQLGVVISRDEIPFPEEFAVHSLVRGYNQAVVMDQSRERISEIETFVRPQLKAFIERFSQDLENPRMQGLSFSVDFKTKELCDKFILKRFENGILFYPAGNKTARFRLNLSFRPSDISLLFKEMSNTLAQAKGEDVTHITKTSGYDKSGEELWNRHIQEIVELIRDEKMPFETAKSKTLAFLESHSSIRRLGLRAEWIDRHNFSKFEKQIQDIETQTYEPVRQTSTDEFTAAVYSEGGFGLGLLKGQELVAICFLGRLGAFPLVRGARKDPFFDSEKAFYALDMTVKKGFQGQDLGKALKMASSFGVRAQGGERIQGRNRDSVAGPMLSINLSMGAYELQHLSDDYPDMEKYRDCFYYTTRVKWEKPRIRLSSGLQAPFSYESLDESFVRKNQGSLLTKVCLSNFVSRNFLENLQSFSELLPAELRHSYTTSGQSECVDKLVKSIWTRRKYERLLSFEGQFFGAGSNMARCLSGFKPAIFPVDHLPSPFSVSHEEILKALDKALSENVYQSVWIEPVSQKLLKAWDKNLLEKVMEKCRNHQTPVVFNDSASMFYRWSEGAFLTSSDLVPDAGFAYVGGQMGITFSKSEWFVSKPLEIISTWDGDEFSLSCFAEALAKVKSDQNEFRKTREKFSVVLRKFLTENGGRLEYYDHGRGAVSGALSLKAREYFSPLNLCERNFWAVIPNYGEMTRFIREQV
jgi:acetylornithine/succinyldiaminopimelate/putrescine aminotransferase